MPSLGQSQSSSVQKEMTTLSWSVKPNVES